MKIKDRKHVDEERCKVCLGVFPRKSEHISDVYLRDGETGEDKLIGFFCEFCCPPSAYLHPEELIYLVDKMG